MGSNELRRRLQAQRWQAQAAHAQAQGEGRSHHAGAGRDGLIGCHRVTRHYLRLLAPASLAMEVSKATVSRDFALVRRIHRQFGRMFGRSFDPKTDKIFWTWDWAHYGFMTPESTRAGFLKPVGHFPFDTRKQETEESYGGFSQLSWHNSKFFSQLSTRDLIRTLTSVYGRPGRL